MLLRSNALKCTICDFGEKNILFLISNCLKSVTHTFKNNEKKIQNNFQIFSQFSAETFSLLFFIYDKKNYCSKKLL